MRGSNQGGAAGAYETGLSRDELLGILDSLQDIFYRIDNEGRLVYLSRSVTTVLGFGVDEVVGRPMQDFYLEPDGRARFLEAFQAGGGRIEGYETALRHKDGHVVWVSINAHTYLSPEGEVLGIEGTARDVTERVRQQRELNLFKSTLDKTLDCVFMFDPDTLRFFYVNEGGRKQVGYDTEEMLQMTPEGIKYDFVESEFRAMLQPLIDGRKESLTFETIHRHKDGHEVPVEVMLQYITAEHERPRFVAVVRDLHERLETKEKLQYLAHHDSLTDLPNRLLFMDRLEHALARRQGEGRVAVLFLDLDRFKVINDTLGHASGDKVLIQLGQRVAGCIRKGDTLARISGDEFAIVLEDVQGSDAAVTVARAILAELGRPFEVDGHELFVTSSIGISLSPDDGNDPHTLLKHADAAMYRAKDLGRNTYQFYSSDMGIKAFERLSLETSLRYALEREEFRLLYQPQIDVRSGRVIGAEALLRWQHPDLGLVAPGDFISLLEDTGLIVPVGEWVLAEACRQARIWRELVGADFRIAVNFSARQFGDGALLRQVHESLARSNLPAQALELEITETALMQERKHIGRTFDALARMGVSIAIDDFGTGYSSLSYLKRFPIDTLKIDRSFIRDITRDRDDAAIVRAIVAMARSLNLEVVAEGIETADQMSFIGSLDCQVVQGFLFKGPLSPAAFGEWLAEDVREEYGRTATDRPGA